MSLNLQKSYICGRQGYSSWSDGTYYVDTLGPTKPQGHSANPYLGTTIGHGGYHWSRCHTPPWTPFADFLGGLLTLHYTTCVAYFVLFNSKTVTFGIVCIILVQK